MEARTSTINANQLNLVRISINEHKKRKEKRKMLVQLCDGPHDKQVKTKEEGRPHTSFSHLRSDKYTLGEITKCLSFSTLETLSLITAYYITF